MKSLVSHERAHAARGSNFLLRRQKKVTKEQATPAIRLFPAVLAFRGMRQRHTKASLSLRRVCADDASTTAKRSAPRGESMGTLSSRCLIAARGSPEAVLGFQREKRGLQ